MVDDRRASIENAFEVGGLAGALGWLRRLLLWQVALTRDTFGALADDTYRGLYVPSAEVDILGALASALPPDLAKQRAELVAERQELWARAQERDDDPLLRLGRRFGLTQFECDVLLLALAPELDLRFERIYAYIQDDVSRRRPAVDLALRLLCATPAERVERQRAFEHDAPLLRQRLLALFEDGQRRPPLLARFIKLDDRIVAELRGDADAPLDAPLAPFASLTRPTRSLDDLVLPDELREQLRRISGDGLALALEGGYGSGRRAVAESLCAEARLPLLTVQLDRQTDSEAPLAGNGLAELLGRAVREARLRGAAILWAGADAMLRDDAPREGRAALLAALDGFAGRSFLLLQGAWEARGDLRRTRYMHVVLPELTYSGREQVWRQQLGAAAPDDATLAALASTFRLSAGQIRDAAAMARTLADWRGDPTATLASQELYAACRAQSSDKLNSLAHKIHTTYAWNDIVLPPDELARMREICLQVRHRRTVLETWGFDKHLAMGKGVNVLFAGPSGTGKTMAAEIIAAELGLELYKIDLSMMVSKYIGETEKNLDRIFTAAREANAILFFDEADAIFGKRSEVKDAHDRYANIEVGYLLQQMEAYDGVVILATNLRKNLDDAFVRRLHVAIDFPFPEEPDRLRIWRKVFPPEAPLQADVDLLFLARQFKLAGGNIRTIALLAAYLAAEDGQAIGMTHIVRAARREYQKIGKLVTDAEFGRYTKAGSGER